MEIVEQLALDRRVETMVENIAHTHLDDDLRDLSQMVYLALLTYDEAKIVDLWEKGQIGFFIARIILNQFRSSHSPWHDAIRRSRDTFIDIDTLEGKI